MIVAGRHEHFSSRKDSRYRGDISRQLTARARSELIIGRRNSASDASKLRKCGLSTDVDKVVRNSNLNWHFRLPACGEQARLGGGTE